MNFDKYSLRDAKSAQTLAVQDSAQHVRLVAGPGTGKSHVIAERVSWLLSRNFSAKQIRVVSFTRASAHDLQERVHIHCFEQGHTAASEVRVTTLHSLALSVLKQAGMLTMYPADPQVMDDWELENIFDEEFREASHIQDKRRREAIRRDHEAFWSTGDWDPPNYIIPDPPIAIEEREKFREFLQPTTQTYSCVLPGEIIRLCVKQVEAGVLDPVRLLDLQHLIVDEFQDLNPMDIRFIDSMAEQGVQVFAAGDDDQSIYSFRFADPTGIQDFDAKHFDCATHELQACFRCTPAVLNTGTELLAAYSTPKRLSKNLFSLYRSANPRLEGVVHRWRFASRKTEARVIAESCKSLIDQGLEASDILVLVSDTNALLTDIESAFDSACVDFESPRPERFEDSELGRFASSAIRIACNPDDYVAHRVLLGQLPRVGVKTCKELADAVVTNPTVNYRDLFYEVLLSPILIAGRARRALNKAKEICAQIKQWDSDDTFETRKDDIESVVSLAFGPDRVQEWTQYTIDLPRGVTLEGLRNYMQATTDEQKNSIANAVLSSLGQPIPDAVTLPQKVQIMTMHGAKGLSGKVVFIPGLEEEIFPGARRKPYPGLIAEAARLLYVSITRAKAVCIASYANKGVLHGEFRDLTPSRFACDLAGPFSFRYDALDASETREVIAIVSAL